MPRPRKWRKVCCLPNCRRFGPLDARADTDDTVNMTVDEYETIRLIDLEGFTQEDCAGQMNISRSTVQGIYNSARKKLAESLVNGKVLGIEGGEYRLCDGTGKECGGCGCHRRRLGGIPAGPETGVSLKENETEVCMKVAIPVDEKSLESSVCPSFGRTPFFLVYNTVTKKAEFLDNSAAASQGGAGILAAQMIADCGVKALLTPRCGENAAEVLKKAEVLVYKTISGTAQENLDAFAAERLTLLENFHPGFHGHGQ